MTIGHKHPGKPADLVCMGNCKRDHAALKSSLDLWSTLALLGVQVVEADETGPEERLELRNCTCGSTLSKEIK